MYRTESINEAINQVLKIEGYKIFRNPERNYFFVVTPSDNILYIENNYFFGLNISLQYIPSQKTGSGCSCLDSSDGYTGELTKESLIRFENNGLNFARRLHANLYKSSNDFFNNYWEKGKIIEIGA